MKRAVVVVVVVLGLASCGGDDAGDDRAVEGGRGVSAPAQRSEPTTEAPTPVAAAPKRDDPKVRRQVAKVDEDYLEEYAAEVAALDAIGGKTRASGEERIDDVIDQACEAKAKGFPGPTDEELGYTMMLIGAKLTENGHDIAGLLDDVEAGNRKVADLVDC